MGVNFTSLAIAVILLSMIALGLSGFLADMSDTYEVEINQSYSNTFDKLEEISNQTNELSNNLVASGATSGDIDTALFQQAQGSVLLSFAGIGLIQAMLLDASNDLGLPSWVVGGTVAIIIVMLAFLAFSALPRLFARF